MRFTLLTLALGGFGIGLTEFVAMGLRPNLAADPFPDVWSVSQERANALVGWLAPVRSVSWSAPLESLRSPHDFHASKCRRPVSPCSQSASSPLRCYQRSDSCPPRAFLRRFPTALPYGAHFGIAALVAASLIATGKRGQGVALVLAGFSIANVIGAPSITYLGQFAGWRVAYIAVAVVFALTFLAVALAVPF